MIAEFQVKHPGLRVVLQLATSGPAVELLRAHRAQFGIVGGFVAAPELEAEPLVEDEIVIVGPPRFQGQRLTREQLEALTWISREEGSSTRAIVEAACVDLGSTPRRRLELPSWEATKMAVRHGDGIAGCSLFAVREELEAGSLVIIPVPRWNVRKTMSIIRIRDAALTPSAERF